MPSADSSTTNGLSKLSTEVRPQVERRRFSAEYKLKILEATDKASESGQIGAILRREGLYSSLLAEWRTQRKKATLQALKDQPAGPKVSPDTALRAENARLHKQNQQLQAQLKRAELLLEIPKKAAALLEVDLSQVSSSAESETP
jgi:transposase-like protein